MAFKMIDSTYCPYIADYRCKFVCDEDSDIASLPACCTGSVAVVANGGKAYMVNASGAWVESGSVSFTLAEGVSF